MKGQFTCPECQATIVVRFLNPGEMCRCRSCGNQVMVPDISRQSDESPLAVSPEVSGESKQTKKKDDAKSGHGLRMVHYTAVIANVLFFVLYVIGLAEQGMSEAGIIVTILYLAYPILNIAALFSAGRHYENRMIAFNIVVMVYNLLLITVNDSQDVRIGALVHLGVAGITAIAFALGKEESWLSLFLERKRLEEKRKIKDLRNDGQ